MMRCTHCNNVVIVPEAARQAARAAAAPPPPPAASYGAPVIPTSPVYYATSTYPATSVKRATAMTLGSLVFTGVLASSICVGIAGFVGMFFFLFRGHSVYTQAVSLAQNDPAVVELFGSPVSDGFFVTGETSESGGSGSARLSGSLSGPKASGQMNITGFKEGSGWYVDSINIYVDGQRVLFYDSGESEAGFQRVE
jgi:hypothetical protein